MDIDFVFRLSRETLLLTLLVSAIPVLAALVVGLVISIVQAATQVQEQTLTTVPKMVAVFASLLLAGPWIVAQLVQYSKMLFEVIARI